MVLYLVVIGLTTGGEAKGSKVLAEMMFLSQDLRVSANCTFFAVNRFASGSSNTHLRMALRMR